MSTDKGTQNKSVTSIAKAKMAKTAKVRQINIYRTLLMRAPLSKK